MPRCQDPSCLPGLCYYVRILLCVSAVGPWVSRTSPDLQITGIMKSIACHLSFKEARSLHPRETEVLLITWMLEKPAALSGSLIWAEIETWDHVNKSTKVATVLPHKTGGELGVCLPEISGKTLGSAAALAITYGQRNKKAPETGDFLWHRNN